GPGSRANAELAEIAEKSYLFLSVFRVPLLSERHTKLHLVSSGRHEVRARKRRQEVVERFPVRQVDHAEPQLHLRSRRGVQQIVHADAEVEQMPRRDSRW